MSLTLQHLLPLFEREIASAHPMVLATVIRTEGPSYTKPGAQMLIAEDGEYAGLLSGGCLEGDLSERAMRVLRTGRCELARYDMRGPDDLLFGLGSGCEGAMDILLQRLDAEADWQPLRRLVAAWTAGRPESVVLLVPPLDSGAAPQAGWSGPIGSGLLVDAGSAFGLSPELAEELMRWWRALPSGHRPGRGGSRGSGLLARELLPQVLRYGAVEPDLFVLEQAVQPRVLLLGAGPDALPVARLAGFLGWSIVVVDHRSHYAQVARFPTAQRVLAGGPQTIPALLAEAAAAGRHFDAAIVMSHHLSTDAAYLRALAASEIRYLGLLGPVVRRERLLSDLGPQAESVRERLRAPVGLDIGASTPESIALSIIAEVQAVLAGAATPQPMSARATR